jgi:hypothetical protein
MRIRYPGWKTFGSGIRDGKNSDPEIGINIPDPQHWLQLRFSFMNPDSIWLISSTLFRFLNSCEGLPVWFLCLFYPKITRQAMVQYASCSNFILQLSLILSPLQIPVDALISFLKRCFFSCWPHHRTFFPVFRRKSLLRSMIGKKTTQLFHQVHILCQLFS